MDEMVTKNTNMIIPFHPEKRKDDGHEITKQIWFSLQAVREKKKSMGSQEDCWMETDS